MTKLHGCLACLVQCALPIRRLCFKTPRQGAETTIYCATSPEVPNHSGAYYRLRIEKSFILIIISNSVYHVFSVIVGKRDYREKLRVLKMQKNYGN